MGLIGLVGLTGLTRLGIQQVEAFAGQTMEAHPPAHGVFELPEHMEV